jgi:hypothetical protein
MEMLICPIDTDFYCGFKECPKEYNICCIMCSNPCDIKCEPSRALREFTPEEAKRYEEALNKLYKPTGRNFFDN